jgi:hypothetical protein
MKWRTNVMWSPDIDIARLRKALGHPISSWGRTNENVGLVKVAPGETTVLEDVLGTGGITYIYVAMIEPDLMDYRGAVLRKYWAGVSTPRAGTIPQLLANSTGFPVNTRVAWLNGVGYEIGMN